MEWLWRFCLGLVCFQKQVERLSCHNSSSSYPHIIYPNCKISHVQSVMLISSAKLDPSSRFLGCKGEPSLMHTAAAANCPSAFHLHANNIIPLNAFRRYDEITPKNITRVSDCFCIHVSFVPLVPFVMVVYTFMVLQLALRCLYFF